MNFVNEDIITLNRISITNMLQEIGPEIHTLPAPGY